MASNPFEKVWPTKIRIPTTGHIGEKAMERKDPSYDSGKGKGGHDNDKGKSQPGQRIWRSSPTISRLRHPQSLHMLVGLRHPAQDKHSWHSMTHFSSVRKKPSNLCVTTMLHNPTHAILDNGCTRPMGGWRAIQRFTQAVEPMKDLISYQCVPDLSGQLDLACQISHDSSSQFQHRHP